MALELHPDEHVVFAGHPSWRGTLSFYAKGALVALVAAGIAAAATAIGDGLSVSLVVLAFVVVMAVVVLVGFLHRFATTYTITNQRLTIERGILSKHVQQTRVERVQNVNTNQTVVDRLLRVGTVDFDTAGTDDSDFVFRGVADPARMVRAIDAAHREREASLRERDELPPSVGGV